MKTVLLNLEMNYTEYKKYHESFMQNNKGSTALHTFACVFFTVLCALFCAIKQQSYCLYYYMWEYLIIVLPTILIHTILSNYIYEFNICVTVLLLYKILSKIKFKEVKDAFRHKNDCKNGKVLSVTCLRGLTYLITVICILAVDFKDFPRYLAKTERYGYSLMDTGVGLFIMISGLTHKELTKGNCVSILKSNAKVICILLILGTSRYLSVKHLDYQNHVTEYGVHWNFFYTLAVCKFLSSLLLFLSSNSFKLCTIVIFIHEFLLYYSLESWVFSNTPRIGLIDANKEGLTSSLGYVALYLFSVKLKSVLVSKYVTRYNVLRQLIMYSVSLIICCYVINLYRPISRSLANMGYCTYMSAITVFTLSFMYSLEVIFSHGNTSFNVPVILVAINDNGLLYFLLANVTTGVINMSVRTLFVPTIATLAILNLYVIFTLSLTVYLNRKGIKL